MPERKILLLAHNIYMSIKARLAALQKSFVKLDFNEMLSVENLITNLPYFLFLVVLAMIYISNTHSVESTVRKIDKIKAELKEVRWNYMSAKSELMYKSKQTEVAKAVESIGLQELVDPPKKIVIEE